MKASIHLSVFLVIATASLTSLPSQAQIPKIMSYQGVLIDDLGNRVADGDHKLTFSLYDVESGGEALWSEAQTVAVRNGIFSANLGHETPLDLLFDKAYWLGTGVDDEPELEPRIALTAAPYSLSTGTTGGDGDITSVNAGKGLSGGALTGDATLGLDTTFVDDRFVNAGEADAINSAMIVDGSVSGNDIADGSIDPKKVSTSGASNGQVLTVSQGSATWSDAQDGGPPAWSLTGNAGTSAGTNFLGTTDGKPLELRANGVGIGTSAPQGDLHISAGTSGDAELVLEADTDDNDNGDNPIIKLRQDGGKNGVNIGFDNDNFGPNVFGIGRRAENQDFYSTFVINADNGRVGVGTKSPATRLDVAGELKISGSGSLLTVDNGSSPLVWHLREDDQDQQLLFYVSTPSPGGDVVPRLSLSRLGDVIVPNGKLGVQAAAPTELIQIGDFSTTDNAYLKIATKGVNIAPAGPKIAGIKLRGFSENFGFTIEAQDDNVNGSFRIKSHYNSADGVVVLYMDRVYPLVGIHTSAPTHPLEVGTNTGNGNGAFLTAGGVWTNGSSRSFKEGFEKIDPSIVLAKVASMPITRWRYRNETDGEHIGPVAEDFYSAFGLGADERYIGTVDADGVALAAIQGLYQLVEEQRAQIEELRTKVADLNRALSSGR